ncbi:unnamed protein product [Clonostachys rosea]|uniref:Uncharacterized protein n=1 Tax=Bionectria ochroleuca TaxID=29856 RepID=A0ABY6V0L2_BIOOC|nr:unnamed protein product [Clonostachys rosea]
MTSMTTSLVPPQHLLVTSTQMPILPEMMAPIIITAEPVTRAIENETILVDSTPYTPPSTVASWPTKTSYGSVPTQIENPSEHQNPGPASRGSYATETLPPMPTVFRFELTLQKTNKSRSDNQPSEDAESIRLHRDRLAATKCRFKNNNEPESLEILAARELQPKNHFYMMPTKTAERRDDVYYFENGILHRSECDSDLIQVYLVEEANEASPGEKRNIVKTDPTQTRTAKTPRTVRIL